MKRLLAENKNIFKALHDMKDFDFNNEFTLLECEGRFTLNGIKKALECAYLEDLNTAIVIPDRGYLYVAFAYCDGFGIDCGRRVYYSGISHFWEKGGFEEARKNPNKKFYIVSQKKELAKPAKHSKPTKLDTLGRYKIVRHIGWSDGKGRHGVSQIDVVHPATGATFTYHTREASASTDVNYFIDKSGYIVEGKKADLKQAAKRLKADRLRAAAAVVDYSAELAELTALFAGAKAKYNEAFLNSNTWNELANFNIALTSLRWAASSLEGFAKRAKEKSFGSIDSAKTAAAKAKGTITEALEAIKNVNN